ERDEAQRRVEAADGPVDRPGLAVERAVHGVADGRRAGGLRGRRGEEPGGVVDDVEVARPREAGERVHELGQRVPDARRRRPVVGGWSWAVTGSAWVVEPREANSVTSCPASARASESSDTIHSIPP